MGDWKEEARRKAEALLRDGTPGAEGAPPRDVESALEELRVQHIELELQNDELRRIQQELLLSRDRYNRLYEFAPVGYVSLDSRGVITEVNQTAAQLLRLERPGLLGRPLTDYVAPQSQDTLYFHMVRARESRDRLSCEVEMTRADGETFDAHLETARWEGQAPSESIFYVALVDVSERLAVQRRLEESEQRHRSLFEQHPDAVYSFDLSGRFVTGNRRLEELTGYSLDELRTMFFAPLVAPEDRERTAAAFEKAARGEPQRYETSGLAKDGSRYWVDVTNLPIVVGGKITGVYGIAKDVTDRKRWEAEALKSQKLESLGLLAGGIAHDFNNLLMGILGNVELARMKAPPLDPIRERLERAEGAAVLAQKLTHQLLTFSRGGDPVKAVLRLPTRLRAAVALALRGSAVKAEVAIPDDLWQVEADEGQFEQVMHNLVINAEHAMPRGGTVAVRAENLELGDSSEVALPAGRYVRITVRDEGEGIPEENLGRIFDPFFTTKINGTGLGLATVYSILKRHNGLVTVESAPGRGAVFSLFFPAVNGHGAAEEGREAAPPGQGRRILVMDDDDYVRDVVASQLGLLGYSVTVCRDGREAVALYREALQANRNFDLVIMDLTVPGGMGGREAMEALLDTDPGVRAVVASGYSDDPVLANFEAHGFCGSVPKPFGIEQLRTVVDPILEGIVECPPAPDAARRRLPVLRGR